MDNDSEQKNRKIEIILRQTDYSEDKAREKLQQFDYNINSVVKDYFGITEKKEPIKSINQSIYKQLRQHLHISTKEDKI